MGDRIGRYEIQAELGRGGFGRVFRAYDPTVGRLVAIKTLNASCEPDTLQRFRNEAAAAGKLHHPNIITVYDFGEHDGAPFLVMELIDGEDVERIISRNRPLPLLKRLDILVQSAAGLHHAHAKGILHRDIKPANIMLQADGVVKIMDFGIALVTQATADRITPQGSLIGTLPYMAPEQFFGAGPSVMTDIFAFGVSSYKLLTGVHPFQASELGSMMHNIANREQKSLRSIDSQFPATLDQLVNKLLAKDPEARYQSLEDVQFDLEPIIAELRNENLGGMISETRTLIAAGQFETAQSVIRQVMEIDPTNRTARDLRDTILRQIKSQSVRPRVTALVTAGRDHLAGRKFDEALREFESALRLDDSNTELKKLAEQARAAAERMKKANRLIEDARRALQQEDLTGAHRSAVEASAADPDQSDAEALLREIRGRIEDRRREQMLRDGVSHVRGLVAMQSYGEAIESATRLLRDFPASPEITKLLERARGEREEQARRQRQESAIVEVKRLLKERRFTDALQQLARVQAQFPDAIEVPDLISYATAELVAESRAQTIARATAETRNLTASGKFDAALEKLQSVLSEDPALHELRELMQAVAVQKAEYQRRTTLHQTQKKAAELSRKRRFAEAIECVDGFTRAYGTDPALVQVRNAAENELVRQNTTEPVTIPVVKRTPAKTVLFAGGLGVAAISAGIAIFHSGPLTPRLPSPIIQRPGSQTMRRPEVPVEQKSEPKSEKSQPKPEPVPAKRKRTDERPQTQPVARDSVPPAATISTVPTPEIRPTHTEAPPVAAPISPEVLEGRDWESVRSTSDVGQLRSFLSSHPNGAHAREVMARIADLTWNAVDQGNLDAVRRFVKDNPENPHANSDARPILLKLEAEQERARQDQLRKQQVGSVLHQLDSALQRKRPADVKSLWPGVSPLFLEALKNGRIEMSLSVGDVQAAQGQERATAHCVLVTRTRNSSAPPRNQMGTVTLRNSGGAWVIEAARFD